jgi:hypothetical protein
MTAACAMASFGSCVQVHHGATCRRPMVPHDVLQSRRSVDVGLISLICPTCQMSISALDECRLLCMGLLSIFWLGAPRLLRVLAPPPEGCITRSRMMTTARGLEPSLYYPSSLRIFTSSACTYSFPQITCPVFSGSSLPSVPEIVPPASRTMICPAAMSQGCKLRSQ